jgi:hypothetical protein
MTLHHFPHQAIDGRWHAVYRSPGCGTINSIGDSCCLISAKRMADDANREQERKARAAAAMAVPPAERPPAAGFYTDQDAA